MDSLSTVPHLYRIRKPSIDTKSDMVNNLKNYFQYLSPRYSDPETSEINPLENRGYGKLVFPKGINQPGEYLSDQEKIGIESYPILMDTFNTSESLTTTSPITLLKENQLLMKEIDDSCEQIYNLTSLRRSFMNNSDYYMNDSSQIHLTKQTQEMQHQALTDLQGVIEQLKQIPSFPLQETKEEMIESLHLFCSLSSYLSSNTLSDKYKVICQHNYTNPFLESLLKRSNQFDSRKSPTTRSPPLLNQTLYIGDYYQLKPDGYGTIYYENNTIYRGSFKNGKREGFGIEYQYTILDSCENTENIQNIELVQIYEGTFRKNRYDGYGIFYKNGRKVYEGLFKEGIPCFYGIAYYENNTFAEYLFDINNTLEYTVHFSFPHEKEIEEESTCQDLTLLPKNI